MINPLFGVCYSIVPIRGFDFTAKDFILLNISNYAPNMGPPYYDQNPHPAKMFVFNKDYTKSVTFLDFGKQDITMMNLIAGSYQSVIVKKGTIH